MCFMNNIPDEDNKATSDLQSSFINPTATRTKTLQALEQMKSNKSKWPIVFAIAASFKQSENIVSKVHFESKDSKALKKKKILFAIIETGRLSSPSNYLISPRKGLNHLGHFIIRQGHADPRDLANRTGLSLSIKEYNPLFSSTSNTEKYYSPTHSCAVRLRNQAILVLGP